MQPDGSLVMCAFETHGGCAKRDFCPFSHKYEPKPSISGLSGEEISSSLQITLAPPGASDDASTTEQDDDETKENASEKETVEPPPKKLRPTEGAKKSSGISLGSTSTKESKPQSVSFVKSFQEILKQKELEKDTAKTEEKTQTEKAPAATRDLTEKKKQETPVAADGKGRKRKNAEQASKKQETPKAAQQDRKKPDALSRISRPGSTPSAAPASTSPKAPPSFGIKSLGELMQEKEQPKPQQEPQAANRATSAVAKKQPEAKKQKTEASAASTPAKATAGSPSVGEKRKLDDIKPTPASTTAAAKPAPTPAKATIEESFDDLEKELDELGVVLDGEEDVDVDIDLGLEGD